MLSPVAGPAGLNPGKADAVEARRNRRHGLGLAGLPAVVVFGVVALVLAAVVSPLVGLAAGAVCGAAVFALLWWGSTGLVLKRLGCRAIDDEDDLPRVFNLVDGLCATMGLAPPKISVIDDATRNAIAVGHRPQNATLIVTTGLVEALDPVALEGVLAHELTHIRRGDVAPATVAAAIGLILAPLWPGVGDAVHGRAGRDASFRTDQAAVAITRYPPGLREALAVMDNGPAPSSGHLAAKTVATATRRLWTVPLPSTSRRAPHPGDEIGDLDATSARMAALDEA